MNGLTSQYAILGKAMAASQQNHEVISQNIANVNTPGYQTREFDFEKYLEQIESGDNDSAMQLLVKTTEGLVDRQDGNNVEIDAQMAQLKKNALGFQAYSQILASQLSMVRRAMTG